MKHVNDDDWEVVSQMGKGTYGTVQRVRHLVTGQLLARKIHHPDQDEDDEEDYETSGTKDVGNGLDPMLMREVSALRRLDHINVLRLQAIAVSRTGISIYTDAFDYDMKDYMDIRCGQPTGGATDSHVLKAQDTVSALPITDLVSLLRQLLEGVAYLHERSVMHRDLKPTNLFINTKPSLHLVVGDLGMARFSLDTQTAAPLSPEVQTSWYRAPEVLMGCAENKAYNDAIDMWSVGAIACEWMCSGCPLFPGDSGINVLFRIFQLLGTPTQESWPTLTKYGRNLVGRLPNFVGTFHDNTSPLVSVIVRRYGIDALHLLRQLLCIDPCTRISATEALAHPFLCMNTPPPAVQPQSCPSLKEATSCTLKRRHCETHEDVAQKQARLD